MTLKAHEFDRIVNKIGLQIRDGRDLFAWFEHEGKIVTCTRRSKGSGDLPMQHSIRQQLKLNERQLSELIYCSFGRENYIGILRAQGLLSVLIITTTILG